MQAIFALYAKEVFDFSAQATGYIFTGMGVILVLNQTIGLKKVWLKYFNERKLEVYFFPLMIFGFVLMDIKTIWIFAIGIFFVTLAQSTLRVVISSVVAGVAGNFKRGETMGIMASIMSVSMIVGPLLGGALFQKNPSWPFLVNAFLLLIAFFIMKRCCGSEKITEEVIVETIG
jgi:DHA1 family multidrug resistance protein-like MFS transporter